MGGGTRGGFFGSDDAEAEFAAQDAVVYFVEEVSEARVSHLFVDYEAGLEIGDEGMEIIIFLVAWSGAGELGVASGEELAIITHRLNAGNCGLEVGFGGSGAG